MADSRQQRPWRTGVQRLPDGGFRNLVYRFMYRVENRCGHIRERRADCNHSGKRPYRRCPFQDEQVQKNMGRRVHEKNSGPVSQRLGQG